MENKMLARRQTKRKIIAIQTVMRSQGISAEQKRAMEANYIQLRNNLNDMTATVNVEEVQKRREFVAKNKGLQDIFNAFWLTFLSYTDDDGYLTKEGHGKFNHGIQIALVGYHGFDEVQANIDADWKNDFALFGPFDKQGFFDLLFETIETWTEIVDPTYYAAFAWSLFDSIADVTAHPPRLKPVREVKCITKMQNEAAMIKKYMANKKLRLSLALEVDAMARVPDVQKRLRARKHGSNFNDKITNMIEVLSHNYKGDGGNDDDVSLSSALSNTSHHTELAHLDHTTAKKTSLKLTDEIDEAEFSPCVSPVIEKTQTNPAKNISFMDYIRKKRNALVVLNNSIDGISSNDASMLFGFVQNYSELESGQHNTDVLSISSTGTSASKKSELSFLSHNSNFDLSRDPHPDDNNADRQQYNQQSLENYEQNQNTSDDATNDQPDEDPNLDFHDFVASGQKYGKESNHHVSTTRGGDRLGFNHSGYAKNRTRGSTGGYQYKAIDIAEVNRQLALRGHAIPSAEHCTYRSVKSRSINDRNKETSLEEKFPRIVDEGGDDLSMSTAASSFQIPSISSRDIPRDVEPYPTIGLMLEPGDVVLKARSTGAKNKKRSGQFLAISGNNLKTKGDVKEDSLYNVQKSVYSTATNKTTTPHRKPVTGSDLAALNVSHNTKRGLASISVDSDAEMTESVKQMKELYDEYSKHLQVNIENSLLKAQHNRKALQLVPMFTNERVPTPLTRPLTGTTPITTSRPLSPAMKFLTDKYSQSFPHGKFADVLDNTHAIRNQPPSSPVWNHTRAAKTLKVATAPLINAIAVEIITKPMTIYDNMKVMREMNEVAKSRSTSPVLYSNQNSPTQLKTSFDRPPLLNTSSEGPFGAAVPKIVPSAPAPQKLPELAIGDVPAIAMNAIIKGLINKQLREQQRTPQRSARLNTTDLSPSDLQDINNTARESATSSYRSISQGGVDVGEFDDESIHSTEEPFNVVGGLSEHSLSLTRNNLKQMSMTDVDSLLSEPPMTNFVDTRSGVPVLVEQSISKDLINAYNDTSIYHTITREEQANHPLNGVSVSSSLQGHSAYTLRSTQSLHRGSIASKTDAVGNAASIAAVEVLLQSSFMKSKLSNKLSASLSSPETIARIGSRDPSPARVKSDLSGSGDDLDLNTLGASTQHGSTTYLTDLPVPDEPVRVPSVVDEIDSQTGDVVVNSNVIDQPLESVNSAELVEKSNERIDFIKRNQSNLVSSRPQSATDAYTKIRTLQAPNPSPVQSDSHPFLKVTGTMSPNSLVAASGSMSPTNSQQKRLEIKTLPFVYQHNSNFNYDTLETDSHGSDHISLSESMHHIYAVQAAHLHMQSPVLGTTSEPALIKSLSALEISNSPLKTSTDVSIVSPMPMGLRPKMKKSLQRINMSNIHLDKSQSHSRLQLTGSQSIPWLPRGTLVPPDHDRSNHLLGWKEKNALMKAFPVDNSKVVTTIKSQTAIRMAFEEYTRANAKNNY